MTLSSPQIGWWGERIAAAYLQRYGLKLLDHQYSKKWGEIDLIMSHSDRVHFIEVKTTAIATGEEPKTLFGSNPFRPEEQVQPHKLDRIRRTAESWLHEFSITSDQQIDVVSVYLQPATHNAWVEVFWGVG